MRRPLPPRLALIGLCLGLGACDAPSEATRVELPVFVDASGITPVTTNLGYRVELASVRIVVEDLVFTVAGELTTASLWRSIADALIPTAHAHPGHYQGGEVTGELRGEQAFDWVKDDGRTLGVATLLAATYTAANFTFGRGSADALGADDPLAGHTAVMAGVATKDGAVVTFTIVVDSPAGRVLVGIPFDAKISGGATGAIQLRLDTADPFEGDTLFDDLDFAALDADGDGSIRIEPDVAEVEAAYNSFRRTFQTHDHYSVHFQE